MFIEVMPDEHCICLAKVTFSNNAIIIVEQI